MPDEGSFFPLDDDSRDAKISVSNLGLEALVFVCPNAKLSFIFYLHMSFPGVKWEEKMLRIWKEKEFFHQLSTYQVFFSKKTIRVENLNYMKLWIWKSFWKFNLIFLSFPWKFFFRKTFISLNFFVSWQTTFSRNFKNIRSLKKFEVF